MHYISLQCKKTDDILWYWKKNYQTGLKILTKSMTDTFKTHIKIQFIITNADGDLVIKVMNHQ